VAFNSDEVLTKFEVSECGGVSLLASVIWCT